MLVQESQASSFLEDGTPLASRVVLEVTGHLSSCVCNLPVFPDDQGNRLSCRDQEGRGGSEEAVPGPSVFPSGEPGVSGAQLDKWPVTSRTTREARGVPSSRKDED